ncbi:MAG: hypothetical protein JST80_12285 [Bdellovibrionales bacterium]|nr:hypothetical protein [Bdellovibrionales bacterium]
MKFLAALLIAMTLAGCDLQKMAETEREINAATGTGTVSYDCTYFGQYNTYNDCVGDTYANCSTAWQTFPTGGVGVCYYPVTGWEMCKQTTTDWVYTAWNVCQVGVSTTLNLSRSVIGCSSAICACMYDPTLTSSCTVGSCGTLTTPTPMPTCVP